MLYAWCVKLEENLLKQEVLCYSFQLERENKKADISSDHKPQS